MWRLTMGGCEGDGAQSARTAFLEEFDRLAYTAGSDDQIDSMEIIEQIIEERIKLFPTLLQGCSLWWIMLQYPYLAEVCSPEALFDRVCHAAVVLTVEGGAAWRGAKLLPSVSNDRVAP
jgi:hypothetical protein